MNPFSKILVLCAIVLCGRVPGLIYLAPAAENSANTVILDEAGVKNLRISTVEAEETEFEQTVFALGRIQAIPERRSVVASRIPGRVLEIKTVLGTMVQAGADVVRLESRQPGDPPPAIWLKAPASGLVTECATRLGEPVDPDKALLEITDLTEVYAVARVPEHLAGKIKAGASAHIRVSAIPDEVFNGTLLRFGTAADKASGTIDAIFALPNPGLTLRPDLRAEFSIVLSKRAGVMSIPRAALQGDALNRFVYVKDYEIPFAFVKSPVQVGAMNDRFIEVIGGLIAGDEVVTTGAYSLAFAGKGSVSLKAALDAAHGHEHNADGSEVSGGKKTAHHDEDDDHDHEHEEGAPGLSTLTIFSLVSNGLLLVLLVVAVRRHPSSPAPKSAAP